VEASEGKIPAIDAAPNDGWGGSIITLGGIPTYGVKPEGHYIPKPPMKEKDPYHGEGKEKDNNGKFDGAEDW
jgi:hypothetical protein